MWLRLIALTIVLAVAGCPKPRRTLVPELPTSGDAAGRDRFAEARARFQRVGGQASEFRAIAIEYAGDPIEPFALLYAGIAAEQEGDHDAARQSLDQLLADDEVEAGLRRRGRLYLGLAEGADGHHARAVELLADAEPAIENDGERGAWLAAMAHGTAASGEPLAALRWFDRWWPLATEPERAFIRARIEELVAAASPAQAAAAWGDLGGGGPAVAILGWRIAAERAAAGDVDGAQAARDKARPARAKLGLATGEDPLASPSGPGDAGRLGAVLPQTSKQARLIEQIVRGLTVAASSLGADAPRVRIEDAEGAATTAAVDRLVDDGVLAILGPTDGASVDAAAAEAAHRGIPLLSFAARADERPPAGTYVFHVMHSAEARARALAAAAGKAGVTRFAILRPKSGYGAAVAAAFRAAVEAQGGAIVDEEEYPAETRSFAGLVKKLGGSWQAVFVPDQADKVALVAPALAAAGLIARPAGTKKVAGGRPIVLLSTVEGVGDGYLREAGRYSDGALLAPGYFPGAVDDAGAELERRFMEDTGKKPTAIEAYAYDALRLCAALVADGARTRADLARRLATAQVVGVTGRLSFDGDHRRADAGVLYTIDVDGSDVIVRALR